jgi:site-specific DNA recombinase
VSTTRGAHLPNDRDSGTRPPLRAVIYARISADREGRELGVQRQEEDCRLLAAERGWNVVDIYVDNDISASTRSKRPRPEYQRLLTDARAGKIDIVLAYTTKRLTRRPREFEDLIDLHEQHGVDFAYVKSPRVNLGTAQGRALARILAAIDAQEAEEAAERIRRQKQQAAAQGRWRGGPRPYGYGLEIGTDPDTGTPILGYDRIRPDEAEEVRHACEQVLLGRSLRNLAVDLNKRGKVTSTGRPWTSTELRKVLRRARNAGLVEVKRPDHTMEVIGPAQWESIIDESTWRAVMAVLDDPTRRTNVGNVDRRWLGSGLYKCGVCGGPVKATRATAVSRSWTNNIYVYRCRLRGGDNPGTHVSRRADFVDEVVEGAVVARLSRPDAAMALVQKERPDVAGLRAEAATLRGRLAEADDLFASGVLDSRRLTRITSEVRVRLEQVEQQLVAASSTSVLAGIVDAADVWAAWREIDVSRRQAVVDAIAEVVLLPTARGRPKGTKRGDAYFDAESVQLRWRE